MVQEKALFVCSRQLYIHVQVHVLLQYKSATRYNVHVHVYIKCLRFTCTQSACGKMRTHFVCIRFAFVPLALRLRLICSALAFGNTSTCPHIRLGVRVQCTQYGFATKVGCWKGHNHGYSVCRKNQRLAAWQMHGYILATY